MSLESLDSRYKLSCLAPWNSDPQGACIWHFWFLTQLGLSLKLCSNCVVWFPSSSELLFISSPGPEAWLSLPLGLSYLHLQSASGDVCSTILPCVFVTYVTFTHHPRSDGWVNCSDCSINSLSYPSYCSPEVISLDVVISSIFHITSWLLSLFEFSNTLCSFSEACWLSLFYISIASLVYEFDFLW